MLLSTGWPLTHAVLVIMAATLHGVAWALGWDTLTPVLGGGMVVAFLAWLMGLMTLVIRVVGTTIDPRQSVRRRRSRE